LRSSGHLRLLGRRRGDCCLGRRDSHADLGAVATQFSNSTEAGTSPAGIVPTFAPAPAAPSTFGDVEIGRRADWRCAETGGGLGRDTRASLLFQPNQMEVSGVDDYSRSIGKADD